MSKKRNRLLAPRDVLNVKKLFTVYMLKELAKGQSFYGKEFYDKLKEYFIDFHVPISYSTIYETLHSLEEQGWISSNWDTSTAVNNRSKRYYRITDEGLKYYKTISPDVVHTLKQNKDLIQKFIDLLM
ncbi:PadR family transcriptional regulator [Alkaliphilus sp. B6464]|uniref:PadR family transcriptional regulator n=1 Tax=Alkaliphilus sp. B6464 TaxID=2731219 RepID=UPI001BA864DB|nr:helix-turn-helix transcriptional regulator [Alkaliphilus sp. B6464]QUH21893.1 helix-turn-helix transcriptional regulator [Alkaliphilus sp. B6464]